MKKDVAASAAEAVAPKKDEPASDGYNPLID